MDAAASTVPTSSDGAPEDGVTVLGDPVLRLHDEPCGVEQYIRVPEYRVRFQDVAPPDSAGAWTMLEF